MSIKLLSAIAGAAVLFTAQTATAQGEFDKLVAMSKAEVASLDGKLRVALDWKDTDATPMMAAFKAAFPYIKEITYERESGVDPFGRYLLGFKQGETAPYEIMHIASEYEQQYLEAGIFVQPPFSYAALNKDLPAGWPKLASANIGPKGYFMATTGNARGIIYNVDDVKGADIPTKWEDCADPKWKGKVAMDARNKVQAFQHSPKTRGWMQKLLTDIYNNDVVLVRGQSSVVKRVASGENPIACGINYHTALRTIEVSGVTTIKYAQPDPVPLELATRLFVLKSSKAPATSQLFALWVATEGQEPLGKYAYRGMPWNPKAHKYEVSKGKDLILCDGVCAEHFEQYNSEYLELLHIPVAAKN